MRKNKMMRLASGLLVAVLLTTCVISGTFAKYISEKSASDQARVAKWSFKVGTADIAQAEMEFDLFNTVEDTDANDPADQDTDVKVGTDETIIAPGTTGSFDIVLKNESEVTAKYAIAFKEEVLGELPAGVTRIPVVFALSEDAAEWVTNISALNITATEGDGNGNTELAVGDAAETVTVYWKWDFTGADPVDANDTKLGIAATNALAADKTAPTIKITATITATQVD